MVEFWHSCNTSQHDRGSNRSRFSVLAEVPAPSCDCDLGSYVLPSSQAARPNASQDDYRCPVFLLSQTRDRRGERRAGLQPCRRLAHRARRARGPTPVGPTPVTSSSLPGSAQLQPQQPQVAARVQTLPGSAQLQLQPHVAAMARRVKMTGQTACKTVESQPACKLIVWLHGLCGSCRRTAS